MAQCPACKCPLPRAEVLDDSQLPPHPTTFLSTFAAYCDQAQSWDEVPRIRPGYYLARHVQDQVPDGIHDDQWWAELRTLLDSVAGQELGLVWEWFCQHYPKHMGLLSEKAKRDFLTGVERAYKNGCIIRWPTLRRAGQA